MKNLFRISGVILLTLSIFLIHSCEDKPTPPALTTLDATEISCTTATSGGDVINEGGAPVISRGVCWNTSAGPTNANRKTTDSNGLGTFSSNIIQLTPNTMYYIRAYATNSAGTGYGSQVSFTTFGIADVDGNGYKIVRIGTQIWMAENLKTSKYNDGTNIPLITSNTAWDSKTTPGYCWYNNDKAMYADTYGALYNWYTVATGNLCPTGWHVPTNTDWTTLQLYLTNNGYGYQGSGNDIAKSMAAKAGWQTDDTPGAVGNDQKSNNSSGFSALPGGWRIHGGGSFSSIGVYGYWWLATESPFPPGGYNITMYNFSTDLINTSAHAVYGLSVRCIKE